MVHKSRKGKVMKRSLIVVGAFGMAFILTVLFSSKALAQAEYYVSVYPDDPYYTVNIDGENFLGGGGFFWPYGTYHTLLFQRQFVGGHWHVFNRWYDVIHWSPSYDNPVTIRVTGIGQWEADTYNQYSVQFQNNFPGTGNGGIIYVSGIQYNSPTSEFLVVQIDSINASAVGQDFNGMHYAFDHWSDGSTSSYKYFKPTDNTTYTAQFVAKPFQVTVTSAGGPNYQPVVLTWQVHPNPDVTYDIWLRIRSNGVTGDPMLQASSLSHTTTSYTSPVYINLPNGTDLLYWDVRAYHSPTGTSADPWWTCSGYGTAQAKITANDAASAEIGEEVWEFAVSNYPNPFNPTTTIRFSLPHQAQVIVEIFNALGAKVRTLINGETYQRGYYNVTWDGKDSNGRTASSGMYFYRIVAGQNVKTVKMLLMK
jgi:hypothetical protein